MSNGRIRKLFNERLKEGIKGPDGKLRWRIRPNGVLGIPTPKTHIDSHLIPAPVLNDTLSGDHEACTGIFQMTIKVLLPSDTDMLEIPFDPNEELDEIVEVIQKAFPINARIGTEGEFVVQVLSTLTVTPAIRAKDDIWWEAHAYFNYRSDTNIII